MIRPRFALASLLLLGACATATVAIKADFDFSRVKRVAVVGFSDSPGRPGSGEALVGAFEQDLLAAGYDLVERAQVDKILGEKKLSASDPKAAKEIGRLLGVDALLFGRITDFREPREVLTQADVVDVHQDPIYVRKTRRTQNPDGTVGTTQETEIQGYRTTRVVRREPRTVTTYGRLGVSARLVYVPTAEVLWSGSDATSVYTFEESARSVAGSILKAVKKTWPSQLKP
ncbi:MAG: CsgG/HfaB family protein [Elusimicrobia bacterium]|nr:CsgG/HfaB family protein [Elusimicrobiota bacterium]